MTEEITPAAGSPESLVLSMIALITNPKAAKDHVLAIVAERAAADKRLAAADKREAEVAAQAAELAKHQTTADAREAALGAREAIIDEKYAEFDAVRAAAKRDINMQEEKFNRRLMHYAGLQLHPLQSMPSSEQLDRELQGPRDFQYHDDSVMAVTEPVPMAAGGTLARTTMIRSPRPSRHDA